MKKIVLMILITFIICIFILLYNPYNKYLGVYSDTITIEYIIDNNSEYKWICTPSNDNLKLYKDYSNTSEYKITYKANNDGKTDILCLYQNEEKNIKYVISYLLNIENNKIFWLESSSQGLLEYPDLY